jgi:hypothetical protein
VKSVLPVAGSVAAANVAASEVAVAAEVAVVAVAVIAVAVAAGVVATAAIAVAIVAVAMAATAAAAVTDANSRNSTRCFSQAGRSSGLFFLGQTQIWSCRDCAAEFPASTAGSPWLHKRRRYRAKKRFSHSGSGNGAG